MLSYIKLLMWGVTWLPIWCIVSLYVLVFRRPTPKNCLTWALREWDTAGGYLVIRWSRLHKYSWIIWPHFLWLSEKDHHHLIHYVPKSDPIIKTSPVVFFDGQVIQGDEDSPEN